MNSLYYRRGVHIREGNHHRSSAHRPGYEPGPALAALYQVPGDDGPQAHYNGPMGLFPTVQCQSHS